MSGIRIIDWRQVPRNSLIGFCKVALPSGMTIADIAIHRSEQGLWASPPSKPMVGRDGVAMKDDNGKVKYSPLIEFTDKQTRDRFSTAVVAALIAEYPEVGV